MDGNARIQHILRRTYRPLIYMLLHRDCDDMHIVWRSDVRGDCFLIIKISIYYQGQAIIMPPLPASEPLRI